MTKQRSAKVQRTTSETDVYVAITLNGTGESDITTGLGFLDHMLESVARHARINLSLRCTGDVQVDDHHTVEDCALVFGQACSDALGERCGIERFGYTYAPLDESLCRAVVDFSGRPHATVNLDFSRDMIGAVSTENISHFFRSFTVTARCTLHIDLIRGENDHHIVEAAMKAFALALRNAIHLNALSSAVPSTKGTLT